MVGKKNQIVSKFLKGELGLLLALIFIVILFTLLSDYFLIPKNLFNITRQVSTNLIVAIGMTFVILNGEIDLSVGGVAALSGIATASVLISTGSMSLAIITGILIGMLVGVINGILVIYGKVQSFIVTLAMMGIARGTALFWCDGRPISNLAEEFSFFGAGFIKNIPVSSIIAIFIFIIAYIFIHRTKHGLYIRSIGANLEASKLSAIPINRYRIITFITSGTLSGVAGVIITSRLLSAQPVAATGLELDVIAAVILGGASLSGGIGTMIGTLLGSTIIGVIDNGMNLVGISAFFQQIVKGIIILAAVLIKRRD